MAVSFTGGGNRSTRKRQVCQINLNEGLSDDFVFKERFQWDRAHHWRILSIVMREWIINKIMEYLTNHSFSNVMDHLVEFECGFPLD